MIIRYIFFFIYVFQWHISSISCETVHGCTINNNNRQTISTNKTSVILSCANNEYILVRNLTFGVHKTASSTCSYQPGDCTTRTTYIGMECNGLTKCHLDLNPQYLHICSQYSDYMVLDYLCLRGESLSVCDNRLILTKPNDLQHRVLIRSPNYPNEYENSLNCSCKIETKKSTIEFLDFSLEERDEMNLCSRDYLKIDNQSYCDSMMDSKIQLNSLTQLTFKTNDVITRKGFWLMIQSDDESIQISCRNSFESPFPTTSPSKTTTATTTTVPSIPFKSTSLITITNSTYLQSTSSPSTLSMILLLTIIFVIVLLILNLILIILCCRQKQSKERMNPKINHTHRPFACSKRLSSSSSSSITYGETPVLTSLDTQKRQTTSTTTTATGTYEDPNELLIMQQQQHNHPLYLQHRPEPKTFCPIILPPCSTNTGYNRMIHCHQTLYPHYSVDSQHIYETIQDGYCAYQRLAATLRRQQQQQQQCTCSCSYNEQKLPIQIDEIEKDKTIELNPETLV
ncbi:hypothetical protein I4U23_013690 [Adineta vaga]|nr:hypothetical protein I4U23_013690 [Adineta vaga]